MDGYQREDAIGLLCIITEVDEDTIEEYNDVGLEAWLGELGYEWKPNSLGLGAWIPIPDPIVFAPFAAKIESNDDFGPLFAAQEVQG
jgi:hypothetical protein